MKVALKARAEEVSAKEEDIAAEQEHVHQAEAKLHSTKVRLAALDELAAPSLIDDQKEQGHLLGQHGGYAAGMSATHCLSLLCSKRWTSRSGRWSSPQSASPS